MHTLQIPILPKLYQDLHDQVNRQSQLSAIRKYSKCQPVVSEHSATPLELEVDMAEVFADDVGPSPDEKQFSIFSASGLELFTGIRWERTVLGGGRVDPGDLNRVAAAIPFFRPACTENIPILGPHVRSC